jgi:hypothetical protein
MAMVSAYANAHKQNEMYLKKMAAVRSSTTLSTTSSISSLIPADPTIITAGKRLFLHESNKIPKDMGNGKFFSQDPTKVPEYNGQFICASRDFDANLTPKPMKPIMAYDHFDAKTGKYFGHSFGNTVIPICPSECQPGFPGPPCAAQITLIPPTQCGAVINIQSAGACRVLQM